MVTMRFGKMSVALIILAYIFFSGCDRAFTIKGTIFGLSVSRSSADLLGSVRDKEKLRMLSGVDVKLFLSDEPSNLVMPDIHLPDSDETGQYRLHYVGPAIFSRRTFLEFRKEGYKTKQVYFLRTVSDPTVEIKPCGREERTTACWVINIIMLPENQRGSEPGLDGLLPE